MGLYQVSSNDSPEVKFDKFDPTPGGDNKFLHWII